ncbi:hypothetical protein AS026_05115 [Rhizobium altiplani]|nr:hypothetical protein AS026_05115 [Rhizobium altiplani]
MTPELKNHLRPGLDAPRQFWRRWSDEFKERAVAEAMEPGASVSAIAHRLGIQHPSQLFS